MRRFVGISLILVFVAACGAAELRQGEQPAATTTPIATATRTPTATPTPTPTPTAPAPPAVISGDPRALSLAEPVRQSGAPCGFVDTMDFPLDPPDGESASGGGDFARFRERYDGYHAGEDWRFGRSTSFGQPVYSIAHGQVTYAQPLGWGADKGVVIVEHTFRNGRRILSFYGHLDPPSVTLRPGQCVARGDQVGNIGDPRTSPHLHFEIRVHMPDIPGPGYWPSDPRRRGWKPPSATIWFERMVAQPGVRWGILRDEAVLRPLGVVDGSILAATSAGDLLAIDPEDGRTRWSQSLPEAAGGLLLQPESRLLFVASPAGVIEAYSTSALARGEFDSPAWTLDLGEVGIPDLAPLSGGGLIAGTRSGMSGISVGGEVLWSSEGTSRIGDWANAGSALAALTGDRVWIIEHDRATSWPASFDGQRIIASEEPIVYAADGLYRLDLERRSAELIYALPRAAALSGDLIELPGGGQLVAHMDTVDSRLIAFEADGSRRWERSVASLDVRSIRLLAASGQTYAVMQFDLGNAIGVNIFHVDAGDGSLMRIFSGGTRASSPTPVEASIAGDTLLISISGVGLFALEPDLALEAALSQ